MEAQRLAEELEGLLEASSEPVLYFGDEPGPTWVTLWRDPVEAGLTLALALPFDDPDPVEHHISQMLTAGIGEDLVDPDDDQVLIAWQSEDIADGSDAEVATLLTLAVITAYQPAIHLSQCHWRGPEPDPEEVDQLRRRIAEPGIFADDCGLPTARIREVQTQAPSPPGHVGF